MQCHLTRGKTYCPWSFPPWRVIPLVNWPKANDGVWFHSHDSQFEYLYKFVSAAAWDAKDADESSNRLQTGDKYMNEGTLYAAKFNENGGGIWLPLTLDSQTTTAKP